MDDFPTLVKRYRNDRGWSQGELAERTGTEYNSIGRIERHLVRKLRESTFEGLAKAFGFVSGDAEWSAFHQAWRSWRGDDGRRHMPGEGEAGRQDPGRTSQSRMPSRLEVLPSTDQIIERAVQLLQAAKDLEPGDRSILLTVQAEQGVIGRSAYDRRSWYQLLAGVLDRGWRVTHLLRTPEGKKGATALAEEMTQLIDIAGKYQPYYLREPNMLSTDHDFILVPDKGAIIAMYTDKERQDSSGYFLPDRKAMNGRFIKPLGDHFSSLKDHAKKLLTRHRSNSVDFERKMSMAESEPGARFVIMEGLGASTIPDRIMLERLESLGVRDIWTLNQFRDFRDQRTKRTATFKERIKIDKRHDICRKIDVDNYIMTGWHSNDDPMKQSGGDPMSPEEVGDHLDNVATLLDNHNYRLAVVDNDLSTSFFRVYWAVKENIGVYIEAIDRSGDSDKVGSEYVITEPDIVHCFFEFFTAIWDRLPERVKGSEDVQQYLRFQASKARMMSR